MDEPTPQEYRSIDVTKFPLSVCRGCGAAIATSGRDTHNRFHTWLERIEASARKADSLTPLA